MNPLLALFVALGSIPLGIVTFYHAVNSDARLKSSWGALFASMWMIGIGAGSLILFLVFLAGGK